MATNLLEGVTEVAGRLLPPLTIVGMSETGSFDDAAVELRDGHVVWWIVRERSVLQLVAAPEWDSKVWYDADLLNRFLGYGSDAEHRIPSGSVKPLADLMNRTVQDLIEELKELRQPVAAAFNQPAWQATRRQLLDLGRRRDAELFGRPYPPTD